MCCDMGLCWGYSFVYNDFCVGGVGFKLVG